MSGHHTQGDDVDPAAPACGARVPATVISFDAGGVLIFPNWSRVSTALAASGIEVSAEVLALADARAKFAMDRPRDVASTDNAGHGARYFIELMKAAGIDEAAALVRGLDAVRQEHHRRNLWESPGPGVAEALAGLRDRGVRLMVVSNSDGRLHGLMQATGLDRFFDLVVDSTEAGVEKPDPRIFAHALAAIGATPAETAHVGDFYQIDVVGARAAGLEPFLLDPYDLYAGCDCTRIRRLQEL